MGVPLSEWQDSTFPGQYIATVYGATLESSRARMGQLSRDAADSRHLMNEINDDPKIVADQLGHTLDVNQNVYTRTALARRKSAVDALERAVL